MNGDMITVERIVQGHFLYIAVAGGINTPKVLGSRSTYVPGEFGGIDGRRLQRGDILPVGIPSTSGPQPIFHPEPTPVRTPPGATPRNTPPGQHSNVLRRTTPIKVMRGPQASMFSEADWTTFLGATYVVSRQSNRMGYRLEGPALTHNASASLLSEPTCIGAIQVPDNAPPIVLMNDGPTVGGYPKIAVVADEDLSLFAQRAPGDAVRFTIV
jgi:antagonist of KipI